ncbi:hypothetical protein FB45DRAFT_752274 [Roridomyces roridus]|uniref:Tetraspanin Tsp2 n=1 Tax=Roridomyces roridus TaxID=1738132 RepID=A0AAD7BJS0_9AGAR|nr:hypothetical protein FB45DRAFT_752274 [Roridomyces roridus]
MSGSTRHILAPSSNMLEPPSAPFRPVSPSGSTHSLATNYLPSKFSNSMLARRRGLGGKGEFGGGMLPRGGGVEAFRAGASRMPSAGDEDYDGVDPRNAGGLLGGVFGARGRGGKAARWTRFKAILFVANIVLAVWSLTALLFIILVWLHVLEDSPIITVANTLELRLSTAAAAVAFAVSLLGFPGILLNNRPFLAVYTFMLWVVFGLLVVPGYVTYKRRNLNIEGKINQQWSQELGAAGRLVVQNMLGCCGYFSPFVEATVTPTCYARSVLPGCKADFLAFERRTLERWYTISFALVPVQIAIIVSGLLCSNHVTYRFGKGMMPKAYRLSKEAMAVIVESYAQQLADQYGTDAAAHMVSGLPGQRFDSYSPYGSTNTSEVQLSTMPYAQPPREREREGSHAKYDSVGARADSVM